MMEKVIKLLNSTFLQTVFVAVSTLTAFIFYRRQKNDEIKNAAKMVLSEIDVITDNIKRVSNLQLPDYFQTAPFFQELYWFKVRDKLIGKLSIKHLKTLDEFYNQLISCEQARNYLQKTMSINEEDKVHNFHSGIYSIFMELVKTEINIYPSEKINRLQDLYSKYTDYMILGTHNSYVKATIKEFKEIDNATYDKLESIANG